MMQKRYETEVTKLSEKNPSFFAVIMLLSHKSFNAIYRVISTDGQNQLLNPALHMYVHSNYHAVALAPTVSFKEVSLRMIMHLDGN